MSDDRVSQVAGQDRTLAPLIQALHDDVLDGLGCIRRKVINNSAWNLGILVEAITSANAVVTIGDDDCTVELPATNEKYRSELFALLDPLEILRNFGIVLGKQWQPT